MSRVLIAGGGVAGASLAILLGRRGVPVELFEQERFPREKPCGEGLMPGGVAVLRRLGLEQGAAGQPFYGIQYHASTRSASTGFPERGGFPAYGLGLRRKHFDRYLFETASCTPGVRVHEGVRVEGVLAEQGRVSGLMAGGRPYRSGLTIAADGAHSIIRHRLKLDRPVRRKRAAARRHFRLREGVAAPGAVEVFFHRGHEVYVTPLPRREVLVAVLFEAGQRPKFESWLQEEPALAALLDGSEAVSDLVCVSPLGARASRCSIPGLILLGDAAGFQDPVTGGGMTQALLSSELLSSFPVEAPSETWAVEFERRRAAMLRRFQWMTATLLWMTQMPGLHAAMVGMLSRCPPLFSRLVGISAGMQRSLAGMRPSG